MRTSRSARAGGSAEPLREVRVAALVVGGRAADMAPSGSLRIPVAVLLLLLWGAPWTHGRRSDVRIITDENWRELLEGEWMIEFYAPWCPACQNLQPEWESFAEWGEDLEVNVAKVDVTEQPGLSGRFIISALPTVYHCKNGEFRRYQGPRTKKDFINFISEKEWKSIEPVSSWVGPGSVLMSSMSALFQLSMWIRTYHNYFIEDLGLPVWGSYTVFGLATLLSGLLLGLCMIFVADCLCPSKRRRPQPYPSKKLLLESSQPLKKVEEEQEADEEDVSEEEPESKEGINTDFAQNAIRQRSVSPSLATDKSS
ncbi:PREDICTED: thioredoxin-related transmembrane protein 1 [Lipotes vexillifer]|uniref:Thioredoxin-related transmembrane protein 1 n=1 Tax=Lipotes vexillifer TaxID=118797 RepID=A0A340WDJ7_LIPVE|nr:PREDICTED: thioredoxin-related transmembrane protein 1 [Lipotes vexillifer]